MMKPLAEFKLETYFSKWEFKARHHMTASDAESLSIRDLLAMATAEEREAFEGLWLGYTETFGAPDLREAIAAMYEKRDPGDILCFAGASEGIYAANKVLLNLDSHAIVITPNYQSHESLPLAICDTTGVPLEPEDSWSLDVDRIAQAIKPNTKLVTINFPHNPTGAMLPTDRLNHLLELCRKQGIYILSDEIFNGLGRTDTKHMPYITNIYERGLSLNVMSKAYGLPGLRIGWIACADFDVLSKMERTKHYLSIANSGPSERLTMIALRNRDQILARNCKIIDENLTKLTDFFKKHADLFEWQVSDASCMAFPRYKGVDGVENFILQLLEKAGFCYCHPVSINQICVTHRQIAFVSALADWVWTQGSWRWKNTLRGNHRQSNVPTMPPKKNLSSGIGCNAVDAGNIGGYLIANLFLRGVIRVCYRCRELGGLAPSNFNAVW